MYKYFIHQISRPIIFINKILFSLRYRLSFYLFSKKIYPSEFKKHCLITGMTWSWKSELLKYLINFQIFKNRSSIIIIDPHWDVAKEIVSNKYLDKSRVVYFTPELLKQWVFALNPFAVKLNDNEIDIYSNELALVFEEMIKSSSTLTLNMKSLLVPCIAVLLKRENSSLRDLQRFMLENNEDLVALWTKSKNPAVASFYKDNFNSPIYSITKQSIAVKIQSLLNSHIFTKITSVNETINLKWLISQKKIIVFNLSKWMLWSDVSQAIGRFIVALVQSIAINRANIPIEYRIPVNLFIDEFQNYTTKSVKSILEESRKYSLHITLASQMLWKNINLILKESITSNTNVKIIGANSYAQINYFAKETGANKEALQRLTVWNFYISSNFVKPFRYTVPKLFLGDRNKMDKVMYTKFEQEQAKLYYSQKEQIDTPPKPLFDM